MLTCLFPLKAGRKEHGRTNLFYSKAIVSIFLRHERNLKKKKVWTIIKEMKDSMKPDELSALKRKMTTVPMRTGRSIKERRLSKKCVFTESYRFNNERLPVSVSRRLQSRLFKTTPPIAKR